MCENMEEEEGGGGVGGGGEESREGKKVMDTSPPGPDSRLLEFMKYEIPAPKAISSGAPSVTETQGRRQAYISDTGKGHERKKNKSNTTVFEGDGVVICQ